MRWSSWRHEGTWAIGWIGEGWWFSLANMRDAIFLDVGPWRIRWERHDFRPLFSERYGYDKWHKVGRLAVNRSKRTKGDA